MGHVPHNLASVRNSKSASKVLFVGFRRVKGHAAVHESIKEVRTIDKQDSETEQDTAVRSQRERHVRSIISRGGNKPEQISLWHFCETNSAILLSLPV